MFRMDFGRDMLETDEEQLSMLVHAYEDSSLRVRLRFMHTQPLFLHMRACS